MINTVLFLFTTVYSCFVLFLSIKLLLVRKIVRKIKLLIIGLPKSVDRFFRYSTDKEAPIEMYTSWNEVNDNKHLLKR